MASIGSEEGDQKALCGHHAGLVSTKKLTFSLLSVLAVLILKSVAGAQDGTASSVSPTRHGSPVRRPTCRTCSDRADWWTHPNTR